MEIGLLFMTNKPIFELKNTTYKLSIQLGLNGFSFCIANTIGEIITHGIHFSKDRLFSEEELKQHLITAFTTKPELQAQFEAVTVIYTNDLYCFVPKEYYNEAHKELYFKYSVKTLVSDFISADELEITPIVNLFIPYVNINNYLIDRFNEFNFQHSSGLLTNYLLQKEVLGGEKKVYLYFNFQYFDIIITKGKELQLCNTYMNQSNEDVLYYLLFVVEQLELSVETTEVILLNSVPESLYDLLYTYIRNITKSTSDNDFTLIHRLALKI